MNAHGPELRRALSLPLITFYGLGTILGAGIYVLVGKVAGAAGMYAPVAFLLAAVVVAFTALSYAELAGRYPLSAAEAVYVQEGFGRRELSLLVGLLISFAGLVSSATIAKGFVGYLNIFVELPAVLVIVLVVLLLGLLSAWGILESVTAASVATVVEIFGLLLIVVVSRESFSTLTARLPDLIPPMEANAWWDIALGAFLAFYAFIGFEDMVNVAEEVKDPQRNMPRAIILALVLSSVLYVLVVVAAVLSLPIETLAATEAPLALIYENATGSRPLVISLISLFAVLNGALIQMIMASRMLFGLGRAGWLPRVLSRVNPRTRTPVVASAVVSAGVLIFALWLPLETLAKLTSFAILIVFVLVNIALIRIKRAKPSPAGVRLYPPWVPWGGALLAVLLLGLQTGEVVGLSG